MPFNLDVKLDGDTAKITLEGELDSGTADRFREGVEQAVASSPKRLVLFMSGLTFMASAGLRILIYAKQKLGPDVKIYVIGAQGPVLNTLQMSGFHHSVYLQESYSE